MDAATWTRPARTGNGGLTEGPTEWSCPGDSIRRQRTLVRRIFDAIPNIRLDGYLIIIGYLLVIAHRTVVALEPVDADRPQRDSGSPISARHSGGFVLDKLYAAILSFAGLSFGGFIMLDDIAEKVHHATPRTGHENNAATRPRLTSPSN